MKLKFLTINKKVIILLVTFVLCFISFRLIFYGIAVYSSSKFNGIKIVLDAGHGVADVKKGL